jgi:ATPase family associated with various cellular activities (AAA)
MNYDKLVSKEDLQEVLLVLRAHHPVLAIDTRDGELAAATLHQAASELGLPVFAWKMGIGLVRRMQDTGARPQFELDGVRADGVRPGVQGVASGQPEPGVPKTAKLLDALNHVEDNAFEAIYIFPNLGDEFRDSPIRESVRRIAKRLFDNRSVLVFLGPQVDIPSDVDHLVTTLSLTPVSIERLRLFLQEVLADSRKSGRIDVHLSPEELSKLLETSRGLSLEELRRIVSVSMVRDGKLTIADLAALEQAKHALLVRTGCLEAVPTRVLEADVAGLAALKQWLHERSVAFADPKRAAEFGLTVPRGLLLNLPLVRFDPAALFEKYVGETEKSLRRTLRLAEAMSPLVLWVDELEKAFGTGDSSDGGVSKRILGTFLSWLAEHKAPVFVVATANDIERLPPELVRKGRFDEIFFLDLPTLDERQSLLQLHLRKRSRDPDLFELQDAVAAMSGFSGGEIEQVVIAALFTAFSQRRELTSTDLTRHAEQTVPLSVTMRENVSRLQSWAQGRAKPAS